MHVKSLGLSMHSYVDVIMLNLVMEERYIIISSFGTVLIVNLYTHHFERAEYLTVPGQAI